MKCHMALVVLVQADPPTAVGIRYHPTAVGGSLH